MKRIFLSLEDHLKKIANRSKNRLPVAACLSSFISQSNGILPYDQGELGSCTANSGCGNIVLQQIIASGSIKFCPSRLCFYWGERNIEGTVTSDSGADEADGLNFAKTSGICDEATWPYDISTFTTPPTDFLKNTFKISNFHVIDVSVANIRHYINMKMPICIAVLLYDSFENSQNGIIPMPDSSEQLLGGHEMLIIGYDDNKKCATILNSWGSSWGDNGLCYLPYEYIEDENLTQQFAVLRI